MKALKMLGWMFVPYVMLPLQWKKIGKLGKSFGSVWAFIVLIALIVNSAPENKPATVDSSFQLPEHPKPGQQTTAVQNVQSAPPIEEKVKAAIIDSVGEKTNVKKERVVELKVNDHLGTKKDGDKIVLGTLRANENLTPNLSRGGILLDSNKVFKALFTIPEVEEVNLFWQLPLTDAYGKTEDGTVLKITLTREKAEKINWDNFDKENYSKIAETYWEHPGFKK